MKKWARKQVTSSKSQNLFSVKKYYFSNFSFGWTIHSRLIQNELLWICQWARALKSIIHVALDIKFELGALFGKNTSCNFCVSVILLGHFQMNGMISSNCLPNILSVCTYHASVVWLSHWKCTKIWCTKIQLMVMELWKNDANSRPKRNIWL